MTWFEFLHTLNVAALISLAIFVLRVWLDRKKFYREKSIAELEELQAFLKPCNDFGSYDMNLKFLKAFRTARKHFAQEIGNGVRHSYYMKDRMVNVKELK